MPMDELILNKVASLGPATKLKSQLFLKHFSRILYIFQEYLFQLTPLSGFFQS